MKKSYATLEEIKSLRQETGIGMIEARKTIEKPNILKAIEQANDFETLKELVYNIAVRKL